MWRYSGVGAGDEHRYIAADVSLKGFDYTLALESVELSNAAGKVVHNARVHCLDDAGEEWIDCRDPVFPWPRPLIRAVVVWRFDSGTDDLRIGYQGTAMTEVQPLGSARANPPAREMKWTNAHQWRDKERVHYTLIGEAVWYPRVHVPSKVQVRCKATENSYAREVRATGIALLDEADKPERPPSFESLPYYIPSRRWAVDFTLPEACEIDSVKLHGRSLEVPDVFRAAPHPDVVRFLLNPPVP